MLSMTDFTLFSDEEILRFIENNALLFGSELSDDFPEKIIDGLAQGRIIIIREPQGFAVACVGRHYLWGGGHHPADLIFVHVSKGFERRGFGTAIVNRVKREVTPGVSIRLVCEGTDRALFFAKLGFEQCDLGINDWYEMKYEPRQLTAS